jgi:Cd2+/Zn2+-exporting ATPase
MIKKIVMKNLMCSTCAGKIENTLQSELEYINSAAFNFVNQVMLIDVTDEYSEPTAIKEIKEIVDSIEEGIDTYPYEKRHLYETAKQAESYRNFWFGLFIYVFTYFGYYTYLYVTNQSNVNLDTIIDAPIYIRGLLYIGYGFISTNIAKPMLKSIKRKEIFNEYTLMFIATLSAMALGHYIEASLVIILYTIGEYLQHRAVHNSKTEISSLIDLEIDYANVLIDQDIVIRDPHAIQKGDIIIVKHGERIPVDGAIIKGQTQLNTSALTGESKLSTVMVGDYVLSGNINVGETITIEAKKVYSDSTLSKIIDLIENSSNHKSKSEAFITKFAKVYTPAVTLSAFLLVIISILIALSKDYSSAEFRSVIENSIYSAAIFLVVSCPCALVISIPLSYFAGIGAAARKGILFKGANHLEGINHVKTIGMDKTGTITTGNFTVDSYTNELSLQIASSIERFSNHPVAHSIVKHYQGTYFEVSSVEEIPGLGMVGMIEGKTYYVGSITLLKKHKVRGEFKKDPNGTNIFVGSDELIGQIIIKDVIKNDAKDVLNRLKKRHNLIMLTGDHETIAIDVIKELNIDIDFKASLLPEGKLSAFESYTNGEPSMYIGDGINDAPLLQKAMIGVAMGNGSDLAIDTADIIIMGDQLSLIEQAFIIGKKTQTIVRENIVLSIGIKLLFLLLTTLFVFLKQDYMKMYFAIFADVGITLIAVLNALRLISKKGPKHEAIKSHK